VGSAFDDIARAHGATDFAGYETDETDSTVLGILVDGRAVERLETGQAAEIVLDRTPFYGEQGGQVGDTGGIGGKESLFRVDDTKLPLAGIVAHRGVLESGSLHVGEKVHAAIDHLRRERIRRNHTATHLLHWALRLVLGDHVKQSGSHVGPDRLRFDFTHFEAMTAEQVEKVERLVNAKVMEEHPVRNYETSLASAREAGVTALFGEKYGEIVRVLEIGNFSKELCGGTHVACTTEIGLVKITSESSVGANLRRIEAVTSFDAYDAVRAEEAALSSAAAALKCRPAEVAERAVAMARKLKETEKALAGKRGAADFGTMSEHAASGFTIHTGRFDGLTADELRGIADEVRAKGGATAVVLAGDKDGKAIMLAAGSDGAVAAGFDAGAVVRAMAALVGGRGGGKPQMAQAGGPDVAGIDAALDAAREFLQAK
jgi:alanyl-tRNA synthetase